MAGVDSVQIQPVGKMSPKTGPKPVAQPVAEPKATRDELKLSTRVPFESAAQDMRKGIFEFAGGAGLLAAGAVGVALTASAPVWAPIACGVVALGGAALAVKGAHDYGKGMAELIVDTILLPVYILNALTGK
ncbi:MAG: hypothetical protein FJZ01_04775 [Candidatus Sericytochromatia bacterium]|nr:hypothetical protein [Candidatus Tanganyikabacteria bacterium]